MTALISFEGVEGAGKSTLMHALADWLEAEGKSVLRTREPGGCTLGERIRHFVLHDKDVHPVAEAELLLMYAARVQHLREVILPALEQGKWVLTDRFHDASHAYQGHGRELGDARLDWLDNWLLAENKPNLTFLLDLPVEEGKKRVLRRGAGEDKMESQAQAFFERVREGYLHQAHREPERIVVLDASATPEQLLQQAQQRLRPWLK